MSISVVLWGTRKGRRRDKEKRKFLMPWSLGDVLGAKLTRLGKFLGGRLDENVGPILAFVVSVEMKQEIRSSRGINKKDFRTLMSLQSGQD